MKLQPRTAACSGETAWYSESALLICSLKHGAGQSHAPQTTAERIEAALGTSSTPPRVLLGDVELTWRDDSHLHSIELRTGRDQWEPASLCVPGESAERSSMTFELAYDVNRIASVDVDVRVLWDATQGCLALRFGDEAPQNPASDHATPAPPTVIASESATGAGYYGEPTRWVSFEFAPHAGILIGEGRDVESAQTAWWLSSSNTLRLGVTDCSNWPEGAADRIDGRFGVLDGAGNFSGWMEMPVEIPSDAEAVAALQARAATAATVSGTRASTPS